MNIFNRLSVKTQNVLKEIGDCWRLEDGKKHIQIFVHGRLAASCSKTPKDSAGRAELNVISQIRRAARGASTSRRTDMISAA